MKKRFAAIALLTLALSACSGLNFSNNNGSSLEPLEQSSLNPEDVAYNIINAATFFPEVGDQISLDQYINLNEDIAKSVSEYTFTSSNSNIIEIVGYTATCKSSGYATVAVTGPGINRKAELSFWVGSIAGTYVPDSARLKSLVTLTIGEVDENKMSSVHLKVLEGNYSRDVKTNPFDGDGTMFKNGTPFLQIDFDNGKPKDFLPINRYLSALGLGADLPIPDNAYGLLSYDVAYGLSIRTIFKGDTIEFFRQ